MEISYRYFLVSATTCESLVSFRSLGIVNGPTLEQSHVPFRQCPINHQLKQHRSPFIRMIYRTRIREARKISTSKNVHTSESDTQQCAAIVCAVWEARFKSEE